MPETAAVQQAAPVAAKYDTDAYDKVDLSLIPWDILEVSFEGNVHPGILESVETVHDMLNGETDREADFAFLEGIIKEMATAQALAALAVSLGYGEKKYGRDNWRQGFGGDYHRLLRAALRHGVAVLQGVEHDYQPIDGYDLGNSHLGGFVCGVMFAYYELKEVLGTPF